MDRRILPDDRYARKIWVEEEYLQIEQPADPLAAT
jgi:hypothetical protein